MSLTAEQVVDRVADFRLSMALAAATDLGVAGALIDGPQDAAALAERLDVDGRGLRLLLRALVSRGVFEQDDSGHFALNEAAKALLPAAHGGSAEMIQGWVAHRAVYRGLERIADGLRQRRPSFELTHGSGFFAWLESHPDEQERYLGSVGGDDPEEFATLMDQLDLSPYSVIGDVGGGGGGLVRAARLRWPHLRGIVIDLPAAAERTRSRLAAQGIEPGIDVVAADCRDGVPSGADLYVETTVLRYFDDPTAIRVLSHIRAALPDDGRPCGIVLVEMPEPDGPPSAPEAMKSFVELCLSGGQDRTPAHLSALLERAGFHGIQHQHWDGPFWITTATPDRT